MQATPDTPQESRPAGNAECQSTRSAFRIPHSAFRGGARSIFWHAVGAIGLAFTLLVQSAVGFVSPRIHVQLSAQAGSTAQVLPSAGAPLSSQSFSVTG